MTGTNHHGIASFAAMKARTLAIARGELKPAPDVPAVWFVSENCRARAEARLAPALPPADKDADTTKD